MSDSTYCQIEVATADLETLQSTFDDYGFTEEYADDGDGTTIMADSEANYGGSEAIQDLIKLKKPFIGYHDSGGSYGPCVFAFDGERYIDVAGLDGLPFCSVHEDGEPNPDGLANAREYWHVYKAARAHVGSPGAPQLDAANEGSAAQ